MPRLCYFYGIAIYMYHRDHSPPHFHAIYGPHEAEVAVRSRRVLRGRLSKRALSLVREWAKLHEEELADCWERAAKRYPCQKRLVQIVKSYSSEGFVGCNDPLESILFSAMMEIEKYGHEMKIRKTYRE